MSRRTARCPHRVPWFRTCQTCLGEYRDELFEEIRVEDGEPEGSKPMIFNFDGLKDIGNRADDKATLRLYLRGWWRRPRMCLYLVPKPTAVRPKISTDEDLKQIEAWAETEPPGVEETVARLVEEVRTLHVALSYTRDALAGYGHRFGWREVRDHGEELKARRTPASEEISEIPP